MYNFGMRRCLAAAVAVCFAVTVAQPAMADTDPVSDQQTVQVVTATPTPSPGATTTATLVGGEEVTDVEAPDMDAYPVWGDYFTFDWETADPDTLGDDVQLAADDYVTGVLDFWQAWLSTVPWAGEAATGGGTAATHNLGEFWTENLW